MTDFVEVMQLVDNLRSLCEDAIGDPEIDEVSLEPPTPPFDELFFRKTVSWCYALLKETGPFFKFSEKLLIARESKKRNWIETRKLVLFIRTVHEHNMREDRPHDRNKLTFYHAWMLTNGGDPRSWENCCAAFLNRIVCSLSDINSEWVRIASEDESKSELIKNYMRHRETHWDADQFDSIISAAAAGVNLEGLNVSSFRNYGDRVKRWSKIAETFDSREAAEVAIGRVILSEIRGIFGDSP